MDGFEQNVDMILSLQTEETDRRRTKGTDIRYKLLGGANKNYTFSQLSTYNEVGSELFK